MGSESKFTIIGSASGVPVAHRSHASLLLQLDKRYYMLDAGEGSSSSLLKCHVDHHLIRTVFISHMHPDHCSGLPMLIQMMYLAGRTNPLDIYLPQEGVDGLSQWLKQIYIFPEKLPFPFTLFPIHPGDFYHDDDLRLTALENTHLQGYREIVDSSYPERSLESYSFLLECHELKVVYSGDLSSLDDLTPHCKNADIIFLEATHITIDDILSFSSDHHIQKTVLTHIPPELEGKEDIILTTAAKSGINNLVVAADGLVIPL